jgi:protein ImuB
MILLRERLERTKLMAAACGLELIADEITAGIEANLELFPTAQSEATSLNRFIEKLSSRLGSQAIARLEIVSDYRPECSQRFSSSGIGGFSCRGTHRNRIPAGLIRPAWLMETPLELKLRHQQPVYGSLLKLISGPERIEAGWWDDGPITRDYFIAENNLGQLLWIYCEYGAAGENKKKDWYLQGLFG